MAPLTAWLPPSTHSSAVATISAISHTWVAGPLRVLASVERPEAALVPSSARALEQPRGPPQLSSLAGKMSGFRWKLPWCSRCVPVSPCGGADHASHFAPQHLADSRCRYRLVGLRLLSN